MAFNTPSLSELISRITDDLVSRLELDAPLLRRSPTRIFARVFGNAVHGTYGFIRWLADQLFASRADAEYLDLHGAEYGIARKAAVAATGSIDFTGTDGTDIPAGTVLQRSDGVQYETTELVSIAGGVASAAAQAVLPGADGNADADTSVTLISPIAGVDTQATVASVGFTGGEDIESDDAYRARILSRKRNVPMGGAVNDYIRWALEVTGVTRVWVEPLAMGPGTVTVRFVTDDDPDGIIPDAAKVQEVQDYIDDPSRKPVTAQVDVVAPIAVALDMEIAPAPDTQAVRDAIKAELADLLRREGEPGATILLTHIREAISTAAGETDHDLISPGADVTHSAGEIPVLGTITWS